MEGLSCIMTLNISIGLEVTMTQRRYRSVDMSKHESRSQVSIDIKERNESFVIILIPLKFY